MSKTDPEELAFIRAFAEMKKALPLIGKATQAFKYKYATLEDILVGVDVVGRPVGRPARVADADLAAEPLGQVVGEVTDATGLLGHPQRRFLGLSALFRVPCVDVWMDSHRVQAWMQIAAKTGRTVRWLRCTMLPGKMVGGRDIASRRFRPSHCLRLVSGERDIR